MLVVIADGHGFEFAIEGAERKHRTEDSTHIQEIEIIDNRKVPKLPWEFKQLKELGEVGFPKMERNVAIRFNLLSNHLFGKS